MNIAGKCRVWSKEYQNDKGVFETFAVGIGSKRQDGTWANAYQKIKFKKDARKPKNGDTINIIEAFPTVEEWNDRNTGKRVSQVVWQIMEYELDVTEKLGTGSNFGSQAQSGGEQVSGFAQLKDDDILF